ncbi:MAG: cadherin-like domain-containing protein, partial [Alphaproteobacteria bacterium]
MSSEKRPNEKKGLMRTLMQALEKRMLFDVTLSGLVASVNINEGTAPTQIDTGLTVGGTTTDLSNLVLTISTSGNAQDNLSFRHVGTGGGQIGFNNGVVTYGGVTIGNAYDPNQLGFDGTNLSIILNSSATQTALEVLLENVTYYNDSDNPSASRTITYALNGFFSNSVTVNTNVSNDTPVISWNNGATISNAGTVTIRNYDLNTRDMETNPTGLTYTVTTAAANGTLRRNGVALVLNSTFTQQDINDGLITFTNTVNNTNGSFGFRVSDGTVNVSGQTFTITVNNTDTAPSLQPGTAITNLNSSIQYSATTGNYYLYVNSSVNWWVAKEIAERTLLNGVAGHMVTVTSTAENTFVDNMIANSIWLGATDRNVEGQWMWEVGPEAGTIFYQGASGLGGTLVNGGYANWAAGEPNDLSGTTTVNVDAAQMSTAGTWSDRTLISTGTRRYVIEWEGKDVLNNTAYTVNYNNATGSDITNGTVVGSVFGSDPQGSPLTYTITGGTGSGIFSINATTGQITVSNAAGLNLPTTSSYTLDVRGTETLLGALNNTRTITVYLNRNPGAGGITNSALTLNEGATATIASANLNYVDDDANTSIRYTVTSSPANGYLQLTTNAGYAVTSFTQDDIANNRIQYVHNGGETTTDSFVFKVTDGDTTTGTSTFNINITAVNDTPVLTFAAQKTVAQVLAAQSGVVYNAATGNFYKYVNTAVGWGTAQAAAQANTIFGIGGNLANITTAAENTFIDALFASGRAWIGASDAGSEGVWQWRNGAEAGTRFSAEGVSYYGAYRNWASGQPTNAAGNEDYGAINGAGGGWSAHSQFDTASVTGYIIEWKGSDLLAGQTEYTIQDNTSIGTTVADANATNAEVAETLTYSIQSGNTGNAFAIDSSTGIITVNGALTSGTTF